MHVPASNAHTPVLPLDCAPRWFRKAPASRRVLLRVADFHAQYTAFKDGETYG
jgi:hypothetical protein